MAVAEMMTCDGNGNGDDKGNGIQLIFVII